MKPSTTRTTPDGGHEHGEVEQNGCDGAKSERRRRFRVGDKVERELDGLWFPATIVAVDADDTFEIEYEEDQNRELDISAEELRLFDASRPRLAPLKPVLTPQQRETLMKDSLLFQVNDGERPKTPTVVLHHQGEGHAESGYIINGLENNVATGNGLRGIRWLRTNSF